MARQTVDEVLDRIERRAGGRVGLAQAVEDLAAEREKRSMVGSVSLVDDADDCVSTGSAWEAEA